MGSTTSAGEASTTPVRQRVEDTSAGVPSSALHSPGTPVKSSVRYVFDDKPLGTGAYGSVYGATDALGNRRVAVKCITFTSEVSTQDLRMLLRETRLLRTLPHPNILQLNDIIEPTPLSCNTLRIVTPLYDTTLHWVLKNQSLSTLHRRHILVSLCRGLAYMHAAGVVHRDVKPANICLNADMKLTICDLGFARHLPNGGTRPASRGSDRSSWSSELSAYVVTRWYRAPELLCGRCTYDAKVDSWAVGCVAAEMIRRHALLQGKNTKDQLRVILQLLGAPTDEQLSAMCPEASVVRYIRSIPQREHERGLSATERLLLACPQAEDPTEIELLTSLLTFDPARRMRTAEALDHPFLRQMHHEVRAADVAPPPPPMEMEMAFDCEEGLSTGDLRTLISREVARYHPHWRPSMTRARPASVDDTSRTTTAPTAAPKRRSLHVMGGGGKSARSRSWLAVR